MIRKPSEILANHVIQGEKMSSNRPETSLPRTSSEPARPVPEKPLPIVGVKDYVPNVFDLVTPTHRARDTAKLFIPPAFLQSEAVDSSLKIGDGASFAVTRQAIPPGPAETLVEHDFGDWSVAKSLKAPQRPKFVVYKSARVAFTTDGDPVTPADRYALQSLLTEFHALLHPPLLKHPNIVDLLGLAWGSNLAEPLHRLPVLMVEYGDRGTLADVQFGQTPLSDEVKLDLCVGIARGLQALHENGISHGDMKPENIIMFWQHGKLVPKLADFGFAVIEAVEAEKVAIGGTRTWRAPESFESIPVSKIRLTDVYSFGLVAWSIAIDGKDPFDLIAGVVQGEDRFAEIKRVKLDDEVLKLSAFEHWLFTWNMLSRYDQLVKQSSGRPADQSRLRAMLTQTMSDSSRNPQLRAAATKVNATFRRKALFRVLEELFRTTLSKDPERRDLGAAIRLLQGDVSIITK
jgi:serine/threonine protein kinase